MVSKVTQRFPLVLSRLNCGAAPKSAAIQTYTGSTFFSEYESVREFQAVSFAAAKPAAVKLYPSTAFSIRSLGVIARVVPRVAPP